MSMWVGFCALGFCRELCGPGISKSYRKKTPMDKKSTRIIVVLGSGLKDDGSATPVTDLRARAVADAIFNQTLGSIDFIVCSGKGSPDAIGVHGKTEAQVIETFSQQIIPKIVEYEREARQSLVKRRAAKLDDKIWRAYGLLANARRISGEETQALLSPIRMGIHLDRFDRFDIGTLNEMFLFSQPAHLQKIHGRSVEGEDRAILRADYLRQRLGSA